MLEKSPTNTSHITLDTKSSRYIHKQYILHILCLIQLILHNTKSSKLDMHIYTKVKFTFYDNCLIQLQKNTDENIFPFWITQFKCTLHSLHEDVET